MNDQERENAIDEFLAQDLTITPQEKETIRNNLRLALLTDDEMNDLRKRTKKAIEDTNKEIAEAEPGTQFITTGEFEDLAKKANQGDPEAQKKLAELFTSGELKELIDSFTEYLKLKPLAKDLLDAWKEAKDHGDKRKAEILKNEIIGYSYKNINTSNSYIANSKVAQKLIEVYQNSQNDTPTALNVAPIKKEVVNVYAYFQDDKLSIRGKPLTAYDRVICNVVATIWEAVKDTKDKVFIPQQVYRIMNGITDSKKKITPQMLEPIIESIDSSIVRRLKIDATEQFKKLYPKKRPRKLVIENYLLPLAKVTVEMSNGETMTGYRFIDCPPLYLYSSDLNQVVNVPLRLLDTSKVLSNTAEVVVFRERLIQRIANMKLKGNHIDNKNIKYVSLFEYAGIDIESLEKKEIQRKRDKIKKILEHLQEEKYIKGFEEYKEGRAIAGFTVLF